MSASLATECNEVKESVWLFHFLFSFSMTEFWSIDATIHASSNGTAKVCRSPSLTPCAKENRHLGLGDINQPDTLKILQNSYAATPPPMIANRCSNSTNPVSRLILIPKSLQICLHIERLIGEGQKALKEQGIDQLLDEARESNRENDLEHLKRTCESVPFCACPDGKVMMELKAVGHGGKRA